MELLSTFLLMLKDAYKLLTWLVLLIHAKPANDLLQKLIINIVQASTEVKF